MFINNFCLRLSETAETAAATAVAEDNYYCCDNTAVAGDYQQFCCDYTAVAGNYYYSAATTAVAVILLRQNGCRWILLSC